MSFSENAAGSAAGCGGGPPCSVSPPGLPLPRQRLRPRRQGLQIGQRLPRALGVVLDLRQPPQLRIQRHRWRAAEQQTLGPPRARLWQITDRPQIGHLRPVEVEPLQPGEAGEGSEVLHRGLVKREHLQSHETGEGTKVLHLALVEEKRLQSGEAGEGGEVLHCGLIKVEHLQLDETDEGDEVPHRCPVEVEPPQPGEAGEGDEVLHRCLM